MKSEFDILFEKYYERLVLFAEGYVGDLKTAEDMVQDVFLALLSRKDLKNVEYSRSYLYSCVKNGCVDYLRKLKITDPLDVKLFDAAYYTGDFDVLEQEKLICRVEEEIEKLPEQCRKVFEAIVLKDMKYKEAAEQLNLSVNTIKTHLARAIKQLRTSLSIIVLMMIR